MTNSVAFSTAVLIGGGLAAATAAATLRSEGFGGRVVLIGEEPRPPYERPALSKGYLRGLEEGDQLAVHAPGSYEDRAVELRTATRVLRLDAWRRTVLLTSGEEIAYDRVLLATGARPRRLGVPGDDLEGVHVLRTMEDGERLRRDLRLAERVLVVGGGWLGTEVAASARQMGRDVTLVSSQRTLLGRHLAQEIGRVYHDLHHQWGVRVLTGSRIVRLAGSGRVERAILHDGRCVGADLVVVALGAVPRTELAVAAGIEVDDGVMVDEALRASAEGVYAAGDVARAWHALYRRHLRVDHWANAVYQGVAAARSMLGQPVVYLRIPYLSSDQYDLRMEYSGNADPDDDLVVRGDLSSREFVAFWLREGRVVAGLNAGRSGAAEAVQSLIRWQAVVDPARLAEPAVPLRETAARLRAVAQGAPPIRHGNARSPRRDEGS